MSLLAGYKKVAAAVDGAYGDAHAAASITVRDGLIVASDSRLTACAPIGISDLEFTVSGTLFKKAMERVGEGCNVKDAGDAIRLSQGRRYALLRKMDVPVQAIYRAGDRAPFHDSLKQALATCLPFICQDRTKTALLSVGIRGGRARATNNVVVIEADAFETVGDYSIPDYLAHYIATRDDCPQYLSVESNAIDVYYADGSWVRGLRYVENLPPLVDSVIEKNYKEPRFTLSDDWREELIYNAEIAEEVVTVSGSRISADRGALTAYSEIDGDVTGETKWSPRFCLPVFRMAEKIAFEPPPAPSSFSGPGFRGVMMGRV